MLKSLTYLLTWRYLYEMFANASSLLVEGRSEESKGIALFVYS